MEFMDRRHRSLPVQFWLTVESFKNPLETVESGSSGDEDDPIHDPSNSVTVKEDISMIHDLYFSSPTLHLTLASISQKHVDIIRSFARNESDPSLATQRRVRRSVLLAQRQVERDMEQDFDDFERSELWFRAVGDTELASKKSSSESLPVSSDRSSAVSPFPRHVFSSKHDGGPSPQLLPRTESSPYLSTPYQGLTGSNSHRIMQGAPLPAPTPRLASSNIEVLMSPILEKSSESSRAPLFDDPDDESQRIDKTQLQRMEAIQAALTDIIAFEQQSVEKPRSMAEVENLKDTLFDAPRSNRIRDRRAVFDEDNEDDGDDDKPTEAGASRHGSFQLAAPGDLHLSYEISRLGDNVANLQAQDMMLDTLINKAELTGDTQELRLLQKSKSAMNRELRQLTFQKQQYEQQEAANRLLSDRTKLSIVSSTVGEEEGKSVVRYLVEVQQLAPDGSFASGWVVARRYNEFLTMHNKLRERYGPVRNLDFPGKRLVTALSGSFVDTRKVALEKYLQVSETS